MQRIIERIRCNKIKCRKCGDIIESMSVHDFKWCSCGTVAVDGGHEYLRRLGNEEDFEDLSYVMKLVEIKTDGFKVIKNKVEREASFYILKSLYDEYKRIEKIKNNLVL